MTAELGQALGLFAAREEERRAWHRRLASLRPEDRLTADDLSGVSLRTPAGAIVPLSSLVRRERGRGPVEIDLSARTVALGGAGISLTRMEFDLLVDLIRHRGRVRTRDALLRSVWGYDDAGTTRTVDVHIRQLRRKLGAEFGRRIETVIGVGYKLSPDSGEIS